jgi:hypothetical protein
MLKAGCMPRQIWLVRVSAAAGLPSLTDVPSLILPRLLPAPLTTTTFAMALSACDQYRAPSPTKHKQLAPADCAIPSPAPDSQYVTVNDGPRGPVHPTRTIAPTSRICISKGSMLVRLGLYLQSSQFVCLMTTSFSMRVTKPTARRLVIIMPESSVRLTPRNACGELKSILTVVAKTEQDV